MFREAVLAFLGAGRTGQTRPTGRTPQTRQPLGAHCRGADVAECRGLFGDGLAAVCATCPE